MRKRSKYRPRGVIPDPLAYVINGFKPMRHQSQSTTLRIKNHAAMMDIVQGKGTRQQIDVLIAAMNMAEALYRVNSELGAQYKDEIRQAQDAILSMSRRGIDKGSFAFTGQELQAMNIGMEVHDAQLDTCTLGELEKALQLVQQEIRNKKARVIA